MLDQTNIGSTKKERVITEEIRVYFLTYPLPYPFVKEAVLVKAVQEQFLNWRVAAAQNKSRMLQASRHIDRLRASLGTGVKHWDSADTIRRFREERCTF